MHEGSIPPPNQLRLRNPSGLFRIQNRIKPVSGHTYLGPALNR